MPRRRPLVDLEILSFFLQADESDHYGLEIAKAIDRKSGTLYPALARMERAGLLLSHWETERAGGNKGPRRRLYRLSASGVESARDARQDLFDRMRFGLMPPLIRETPS